MRFCAIIRVTEYPLAPFRRSGCVDWWHRTHAVFGGPSATTRNYLFQCLCAHATVLSESIFDTLGSIFAQWGCHQQQRFGQLLRPTVERSRRIMLYVCRGGPGARVPNGIHRQISESLRHGRITGLYTSQRGPWLPAGAARMEPLERVGWQFRVLQLFHGILR